MADKDETGKGFEQRVADAYRQMGAWKVEHDVEVAGNQIDVYVEMGTPGRLLHRIAVEAKGWAAPVGIDVLRGFATIVALLRGRGLIDEGIIISATGFTRPARNAAREHGLRLLEWADLEQMVAEAKVPGGSRPAEPHQQPTAGGEEPQADDSRQSPRPPVKANPFRPLTGRITDPALVFGREREITRVITDSNIDF